MALVSASRPTYRRPVSTRRQGREDKRRRIIDAAVEVFAEKGFFGARVSEIAEVAGVADGTIYLYFKSKDDLLISLFEEKMAEILDRLSQMLTGLDDPEEKLRRYIVGHLQLAADQPELMQVLTVELRQSARFIKEYSPKAFARYLAVIGSILEEGQKKGIFRRDLEPGVFRRALFGAIDEIALEWVLRAREAPHPEERRRSGLAAPPGPAHDDPREVGGHIAEFILRGLRVAR